MRFATSRFERLNTFVALAFIALFSILFADCVRADALYDPPGDPLRAVSRADDGEVRPFITDDSRVVGERLGQLETWCRADEADFQQWLIFAYGPNDRLELSAGGVLGLEYEAEEGKRNTFSYGLPLLQAKYLIRPYGHRQWPGLGVVAGAFLPFGKGALKAPGYGAFSFATVSQCFGEREDLLLHLNLGLNYLFVGQKQGLLNTWGFGAQALTLGGFYLVGEAFSGDPYLLGSGTSWQLGFRHFFSDLLQIDATVGKGFAGENPLPIWFSAGVRIVTERFQNK